MQNINIDNNMDNNIKNSVVMDNNISQKSYNELVGQIYLQPTKTAEFIILDFNVLPTGATFPA